MSDITACPGHRCPDRERCLRAGEWHTRGLWQSWSSFDRDRQVTGECQHFIPLAEAEFRIQMPKIKVSRPNGPRGQLGALLASIMAAGVPMGQALDVIGSP